MVGHVSDAVVQSTEAPVPKLPGDSAQWMKDPLGRFEQRYSDGAVWTNSVSEGDGETKSDRAKKSFEGKSGGSSYQVLRIRAAFCSCKGKHNEIRRLFPLGRVLSKRGLAHEP